MAQDNRFFPQRLSEKLDVILDVTSKCALSGIIIDRLESKLPESKLPLSGDSTSSGVRACVTLFLPRKTPFRIWRWLTDFLQRLAGTAWLYWREFREIQASLSIDLYVLAEIGELVKKCCSLEKGFTFQIEGWGIFYHIGNSFHFHRFKEGDVPVTIETRWNKKRTGIIVCGLHLNGAQITRTFNQIRTTLNSSGPPSKGSRNLDELHIPIEELKGVKDSYIYFHATKVVEFDGMSLLVKSKPSFVVPSRTSLKGILGDEHRPLVMNLTNQQLLVEYWKGVSQMEMIECRNKVIIQFQNLPASQISTFNGVHSHCFISVCPSSKNREYWKRALYDLSEDHLSTKNNSQSTTIHSIGGRIKFLLGEFDSALLDFDCALLNFDRTFNSNMDGLVSTLLDRAMVKCVLAKFLEAKQDINMIVEINPNNRNIEQFQVFLDDILCIESSKSLTLLPQPMQPVYDLLTGDPYPNLDSLPYYGKMPLPIKSMEEFGLSSIPEWTEVEPSKDLLELDLQQGASDNHKFPPSALLKYLSLYGLTGYDSLCTGEKLAEGGQAVIFEALRTTPQGTPSNLVLKVFKQAFPLQTWLQPDGLQFGGVFLDRPSPFLCTAVGVKFLSDDGQCAFVFPRHWGDLRRLIHQQDVRHSPFELRTSVKIMLQIAEGMRSLHIRNILHRDLKASNVLVSGGDPYSEDFRCVVADFECSVGVAGTGFWRAPEILDQLNHEIGSKPKSLAWSKEADVYSFGMTSCEILTGCTPFGDLKPSDWDVVLLGGRPQLPPLDSTLRVLIELCWHADPKQRPNFSKICKILADVKGGNC